MGSRQMGHFSGTPNTDLEREHCTKLQSRMTQRHHCSKSASPIRPGHGRLSVQIGFHTFCQMPECRRRDPFSHLVEHRSSDLKGSTAQRKGRERNFPDSPEGQRTLHKASRSWKWRRKACTVNTSGMGKAFRRFRNSFKKAANPEIGGRILDQAVCKR
ncbi:hypothetical protein TNCT_351551 [Trichonephila clavata]|uniref:Uncharacterized protein n=1 Tax=Trichonephila clavata TaxID=2740835 RepID=A0A8X6M6Q0_TRICU|nr:hypothetical protein TNCT_351551 [Trichonephila clavata]